MWEEIDSADARVAEIAKRQHGVVSSAQLCAAGLSSSTISRRLARGWVHRVHRGVYAVGHPGISIHGRWMAATLACGEGAAVSHRSAAVLWGLLKARGLGPTDVSVPSEAGRAAHRGIRIHRCRSLVPTLVTCRDGIPVTTPARTIGDLRRSVPAWECRRAIRQAVVLGLQLGEDVGQDRTRSDLERDFLRICRRHRLPAPEVNVRVGPYLADFLWRQRRLIVETDSYRYHRGHQAFKDDHARDLELRDRGFEVIRLSETQVDEEPRKVAEVLHRMLASGHHRVGPDGAEETR
ncbi:MAG TPA: type IV toxin-antitoxin system AbiEi family antitoxin domain-containing protein [Solirubrobacterales bacterium]|nr:type IV toxin-antitoxin system AbiEi family antitoxin domain-containing protein [Solirubrobacterales bacterium]